MARSKDPSLLSCKKCGHRISKSARTCPECGHPTGIISWLIESKLILLITSVIGVNGLWFIDIFSSSNGTKKDSISTSQISSPNPSTKPHKIKHNHPIKWKKCELCKGTGKCWKCKGKKTFPCRKCMHSGRPGYLLCRKCKNKYHGKLKCRRCHGKGSIMNWRTNTIQVCPKCKGKGYFRCPYCHGKGWIRCPNCGGKGYTHCPICGGTGKCPKCKGKGKYEVSQ